MTIALRNKLDFYVDFEPWYLKIIKEFKFSPEKDIEARNYLSRIFAEKSNKWSLDNVLNSFASKINSRSIILIYGCGPSLEESLEFLLDNQHDFLFKKCINLAADGASVLLKEKRIPLNGIFTDLDGISQNEFHYADFVCVHAHGDNIEKLIDFKEDILNSNNVIGTTQVKPVHNVINPGGFTDGDRIIFFLRSLLDSHHTLFLIGMDFNNIIGKYSKPYMNQNVEANPIKKKKIRICGTIIKMDFKKNEQSGFFY